MPPTSCPACGLPDHRPDRPCPRCAGIAPPAWTVPLGPAGLVVERRLTLPPEARYEVLATLGRGTMGEVYMVRDLEVGEVIAIKVLSPRYLGRQDAIDKFKNELKVARRINHPNVARVFDLFEWKGRLAISQEYIEGHDLESVLERGPLALATMRRYVRFLCSALGAAHRLGVVHRDLKPANIMIDQDDRPRIVDFGLSFLTADGGVAADRGILGTPRYMAPEQWRRSDPIDQRSDLYSLGIILYRMVAGRPPFPEQNLERLVRAHLEDRPEPPGRFQAGIPPALDALILRCLEKDPARRPATARELAHALDAALGPGSHPLPARSAAERRPRVLVVEDDDGVREAVAAILEGLSVEVLESRDGADAVAVARREQPDLVLLDLGLPTLSGHEVLFILKSQAETAAIPVVILTGETDPNEGHLAKGMGAAVYLNKPVQPDVLELVVEKFTS